MRISTPTRALFALLPILFLSACNRAGFEVSSSRGPATSEKPSYESPTVVQNGLAFELTTNFQVRPYRFNNVGQVISLDSSVATKASIFYAEFHVYDSSGNRIQQGNTGANGKASFQIPRTAGNYKVQVFSRSSNEYAKVSVLKDPYNNIVHHIERSFTVNSSNINSQTTVNLGTLTAYADESTSELEGGAFNIHYNIYLANKYIRESLVGMSGTPSQSITNDWWVADKVSIFWKPGFNPGSYYGMGPLSFYVPGDRRLFILGGISGNVKSMDTDHFDDSIILHEYGHFLEDAFGRSASPGGSHDGNFIIDPRLAWSEGFATYLQAAVLSYTRTGNNTVSNAANSAHLHQYIDTQGYGNSGDLYNATDLLDGGNASATYDRAGAPSEGHFRELSIARTLYKISRSTSSSWRTGISTNENSGANISFANFWDVLTQFKTDDVIAPNAGEFNKRLDTVLGAPNANWAAIRTEEGHELGTRKYASTPDTDCLAIDERELEGTNEKTPAYSGAIPSTDLFANNDFFLYQHQPGNSELTLMYKTDRATTSGQPMNVDLILYRGMYIYQQDIQFYAGLRQSTIVAQSRREVASETSCLPGYRCETVQVGGLAANQYYMINVKINGRMPNGNARTFNQIDGQVSYGLRINSGNYLCLN